MKTNSKCFALLLSTLLLPLLFNCKKEKVIPTVTLTAVTNITAISATSGGSITADGGVPVTARGVCWSSTNATPTASDNKTSDGIGSGSFSSSMSGLTQGTTYNIRAYATNSVGTGYSSASSFKSLALAPTLTTTDFSAVTATSFNSGGNITNDGGSPVTARGVCWGINQNPTVTDNKTSDGTGTGIFTSSVAGLTPGTTYYIRAYSTNSIGTSYGNQISTKTSATIPTLTTTAASSITSTTATSGGNITSDGGGAITARGICWSTSTNPTITDSKTTDGTGTGSFTSSLASLSAGTKYYVRAYATNSTGTAYGSEISFIALANLPTVTTTSATSITATSAISGGNITSDGGGAITARGVCWTFSTGPTISNNKTSDSSGTGVFTSSLTSLTANTTYFVRAYATNSAGVAYGNEISFKASASLPTITTAVVSSILITTASSGGNILSDGGATVIARGVCWSTGANPTTTNSKTSDGTGIDNFTSSIIGLTAGTTYYVRAYATNSVGTAYGNEVSLKTISNSDIDGNVYKMVTIGTQIWMAENLKTTKLNDGTLIPLVTDGTAWTYLETPGYCWYNNDAAANKNTYGALYNWRTVDTRKLCPTGWHVPSDAEWTTLTTYLGGESVTGNKLKETGTSHWLSPNTGATNETGFTALPGGYRDERGGPNSNWGIFSSIGIYGYWWSTTVAIVGGIWNRNLFYYHSDVSRSADSHRKGLSVRCLLD